MAADRGKAFERRHAKRIPHGKRIIRPDFGIELPDGESGTDVWDCKDRKGIKVISWFREAETKYAFYTKHRRFHMPLHVPGERGDFVLVRADDYAELLFKEGKLYLLEALGVE